MNIIRRDSLSILDSAQRVRRDDRVASFIAELALAAPPKDLATLKAASNLCDRALIDATAAERKAAGSACLAVVGA